MTLELAARLPRPTAFVLGGGGSWGALQLGMLQALAATDVTPDLVVGTSVGSLNGAILAADPALAVDRLTTIWHSMKRTDVFPGGWLKSLRTLTVNRTWIYDNSPLADLITAQIPVARIEDLATRFVAVATDFTNGAIAELDSGDLRSALLASSAIPGIFPAVERDGHRLVDGALVANVPIATAMRRGARSIVVLDCGLLGVNGKREGTMLEVLLQSVAISARHLIAMDLATAALGVPVVWLSRGTPNTKSLLDFTSTAEMVEEAREQSLATLIKVGASEVGPGLHGAVPEMLAPLEAQRTTPVAD